MLIVHVIAINMFEVKMEHSPFPFMILYLLMVRQSTDKDQTNLGKLGCTSVLQSTVQTIVDDAKRWKLKSYEHIIKQALMK